MLIYLIEDDALKADSLRSFLLDHYQNSNVIIFRSYQTGLSAIKEIPPDLIILDMTLPTYDRTPNGRTGRLRPLGGYDLLRKVKLYGIETSIVVVTMLETFGEGNESISYADMTQRCADEFKDHFVGSVHFQLSNSHWRTELTNLLSQRYDKGSQ
jgi:DNA-binding NarL/FixJ family response regulator